MTRLKNRLPRKCVGPDAWIGQLVRFLSGGFIGAMAGLMIWTECLGGEGLGWLAIPMGAFAVGTSTVIWGDAVLDFLAAVISLIAC